MAFNPFPVVMSDLRHQRAVTLATVLLVAIAVAIGIVVISQERALRQGSARAADDFDLLVGAPGSQTQLLLTAVYLKLHALPLLDGAVLGQAAQTQGVVYAAPIAFGDQWQGHPIVGTIAAFVDRGGTLKPSHGRLFAQRGEAVIGAGVDLAVGSTIHPSHGIGNAEDAAEHDKIRYTVVGRLPARHNIWDQAILVPVEDVWAAHGLASGHQDEQTIGPPWTAGALPGVPAIAVKPRSVADAYRLRGLFRTGASTAFFPAEELNDLYSTLGDIRDLLLILALACQVLVVTAVLAVLLIGFFARRRQFAVLRAIGAGRSYVFAVVWLEVAILTTAGALVGTLVGYGLSVLLSLWLAGRTGFVMPVSFAGDEMALLGGLIATGLLAAVLPAALTFRQSVAQGLRGAT